MQTQQRGPKVIPQAIKALLPNNLTTSERTRGLLPSHAIRPKAHLLHTNHL